MSNLIGGGLTFAEGLEVVRAGTEFTTHTPVAAGIDRFDARLIEQYFSTGTSLPQQADDGDRGHDSLWQARPGRDTGSGRSEHHPDGETVFGVVLC